MKSERRWMPCVNLSWPNCTRWKVGLAVCPAVILSLVGRRTVLDRDQLTSCTRWKVGLDRGQLTSCTRWKVGLAVCPAVILSLVGRRAVLDGGQLTFHCWRGDFLTPVVLFKEDIGLHRLKCGLSFLVVVVDIMRWYLLTLCQTRGWNL